MSHLTFFIQLAHLGWFQGGTDGGGSETCFVAGRGGEWSCRSPFRTQCSRHPPQELSLHLCLGTAPGPHTRGVYVYLGSYVKLETHFDIGPP